MTRRSLTLTAATAVLSGLCSLGLATPASAAVAGPLVQAETLRALSGRTAVFSDSLASGGKGLAFLTRSAVRAPMTTTVAADRLVLRLRGDQASGAPRAEVLVNGVRVGTHTVSSTRWVDMTLYGSWAPGRHTVEVRFPNDAYVNGRDRNLRLDRMAFGAREAANAPRVMEARVLQLVNAERTRRGLAPVAPLGCATRVAQDWSAYMARSGVFAHRSLDGIRAACQQPGLRAWGENIAYASGATPEKLMSMWMASTGHRANILKSSFTHLGVGIAISSSGRVYGTQDFYRVV